jgi:hypothetical protein
MTLPSSGTISMNNVNVELDRSGTTTISLNDADVRALAGVPSGTISLSSLYGKSNVGENWSANLVAGFNGYGVMTDNGTNWAVSTSTGYVLYSTNNGVSWVTTNRPTTAALWGASRVSSTFLTNQDANTRIFGSATVNGAFPLVYTAAQILRNSQSNDGWFIQGGNNGRTYSSNNGSTFTQSAAIGANSAFTGIYVAALNRTMAVGVGSQAKYLNGPPSAAAWTGSCTGLTSQYYQVAWSPTLSIAVTASYLNTAVHYSTNLINWTATTNPTGQVINGICWADGRFIAVGAGGAIMTSTNGTSWTSRSSGTSAILRDVDSAGGVAIATGDGIVIRSV